MIHPRQHKAFLEKLYVEQSMPLAEAVRLFSSGKAPSFDEFSQAINFLWVEDLFSIRKKDSSDEVWLDKAMLKQPDDYVIALKSIAGKDRNIAEGYKSRILDNEVNVFSDKLCWASLKPKGHLKIVGDRDGATNLAERIRAFTQYFACTLLARDFSRVSGFVSAAVAEQYPAEMLEQAMAHHESDYGRFEFFDHVRVECVYSGDQANVQINDQMKLPKGIATSQRRGEASFKLVSACSPNGIAIHSVSVVLAIVEENERLKVCDIRWQRN